MAILAVLAAILIDAGDFLSGNYRIYLIFYPFIAIAALQGGVGPGLLAIALSCVGIATFWLDPIGLPAVAARADRLSMLIFILGNLFLVGICECLRRAILKAAEAEAHRKSSEELRPIIDLVPHFIFCKDWNGNFLLANKAQAEAYNTTVEELTGQPQAKFQKEENELHRSLQQDREVMETGQTKFIPEETFVDASGNLRLLQIIKIPYKVSWMETPAVLGVAVDITERKRAEQALRDNEAFLQMICETTPDQIFAKDRESRYIMANPATLRTFGKSLEDVIGKSDNELYPGDEIGRHSSAPESVLRSKGSPGVFRNSCAACDSYSRPVRRSTRFTIFAPNSGATRTSTASLRIPIISMSSCIW